MRRIMAAALAAGACASTLQAQTAPAIPADETLTLEGALAAAGASSPAVEAAQAGVGAAQAQRRIARLRPNPSIDAMAENVSGTGAYGGLRSSETTVGLSLPLELGGKRSARVAVADAQIDRATLGAAIAGADLRLKVTQAYNEAAAAQRRSANAREQVGIAAETLRASRVRVQAGRASPLEEQRADVMHLNAEAAAERADRSAQVASANLGRLTGRATGRLDTGWFTRVAGAGPLPPTDAAGTLAVAEAQADLETATAQVRLARSQRIPDLTISAAARRLEASNDVAGVFSLSVPLPLT